MFRISETYNVSKSDIPIPVGKVSQYEKIATRNDQEIERLAVEGRIQPSNTFNTFFGFTYLFFHIDIKINGELVTTSDLT